MKATNATADKIVPGGVDEYIRTLSVTIHIGTASSQGSSSD